MKDIEDEIPFEVPDGWAWCRLNELAEIARGGSPRPIQEFLTDDDNGLNWIKIGDTKIGSKYITTVKEKIKPEGLKKTRLVHAGDFLLTNSMSFGRPYILKVDGCIHDGWLVFADIINCVDKDFLYYALSPKYIYDVFSLKSAGSTVKNLKSDTVKEVLFALPPHEEQKIIVSKIEEIFSHIDKLDSSKLDLQTAIKHAKSKILDLAIHGKLVPQDSSEEPASKLLGKIRAEKEAKIAAGELKRDKNDSYIYKNPSDNCHYRKYDNHQEECIESEIAFSLPESWQWVNLGGIFAHNTGKALNKSKLEGEYKDYITTSNVYWDRFELNNVSKMPFTPEEMKKCTVTKGDLLICEGGDVGRSNIWDKDYDICIQNHLHRLRAFVPVETKLFYYWLMLFKQHNMIIGKGIGLMGFSSSLVHNLLIPLPPLSEQKRIVAKIEEIFSCLENIENNIT